MLQNGNVNEVIFNILENVYRHKNKDFINFAISNQLQIPAYNYLRSIEDNKLSKYLYYYLLMFNKYKNTIRKVSTLFTGNNIPHCFIKTQRIYDYVDNDVNILVPLYNWNETDNLLYNSGWGRFGKLSVLREAIIEPGKKLFKSLDTDFLKIHIYQSGSWLGYEYIPAYKILEHSSLSSIYDNIRCIVPKKIMDLQIHICHCAFERYNLTIGEILHYSSVFPNNEYEKEIFLSFAENMGCKNAATVIPDIATDIYNKLQSNDSYVLENDFPYYLSVKLLKHFWSERYQFNLNKMHYYDSITEPLKHVFFKFYPYTGYRLIKNKIINRTSKNEKS